MLILLLLSCYFLVVWFLNYWWAYYWIICQSVANNWYLSPIPVWLTVNLSIPNNPWWWTLWVTDHKFDFLFFQISPLASINGNGTQFVVRKELTPVSGDTKCSIYLQNKLDYEVHSSFVMQIIAEVILINVEYLTLTKESFLGATAFNNMFSSLNEIL